jgi:hypothetical protein
MAWWKAASMAAKWAGLLVAVIAWLKGAVLEWERAAKRACRTAAASAD